MPKRKMLATTDDGPDPTRNYMVSASARQSMAVDPRRMSTISRKSCRVSTHTRVVAAQNQRKLVGHVGEHLPYSFESSKTISSWGQDGSADAEWRRKSGMVEWSGSAPPIQSWAPSEITRPRGRRARGDPCSSSDDEHHALRTKKPKRRRTSKGSAAQDYFGTNTKKVRNTTRFMRAFGRKPDHRRMIPDEDEEDVPAHVSAMREMAVEKKRKDKTVQKFNWLSALTDSKVRFPISQQAHHAMDKICSVSNFQKWRSYVLFHHKSILFQGFGSKYALMNCFKHQMLRDVSCFELQGFHAHLLPKNWSFQEWFYGVMAQLWPRNKGKFCGLFSKSECTKKSSRFEHGVPPIPAMTRKFVQAMSMIRDNRASKDGGFSRTTSENPLHKVNFSQLFPGHEVYLTIDGKMRRAVVLGKQKDGKVKLRWLENEQKEAISAGKWYRSNGRMYYPEVLERTKAFKFSRPVVFMIHNFENMRLRKYLHVFREIAKCQQVRFIISIDDQRAQELYAHNDYRIFEFVSVIANTHVPYEREFFYEMFDKKNQPPIWTGEHKKGHQEAVSNLERVKEVTLSLTSMHQKMIHCMASSACGESAKVEWVTGELVQYFKTHYKVPLFGNKVNQTLQELRAHNLVVEVSKSKKNADGNKGKVHKWYAIFRFFF